MLGCINLVDLYFRKLSFNQQFSVSVANCWAKGKKKKIDVLVKCHFEETLQGAKG